MARGIVCHVDKATKNENLEQRLLVQLAVGSNIRRLQASFARMSSGVLARAKQLTESTVVMRVSCLRIYRFACMTF